MAKTKAKRAPRYPEKSSVVNFRCTPTTRRLLQQAAKASGKTLSYEIERHLERALSQRSTPTCALMDIIGTQIDALVRLRVEGLGDVEPKWKVDKSARWWDDPYLYGQAFALVTHAFEMFRPKGEPPQGIDESIDAGGRRQGKFSIETTLREIQLVDASKPFAEQTPHERWLTLLKGDLGSLADRPVIWGSTAEQERELRALTEPLLAELIPLSQKEGQTPESMTPEETQRLAELRAEVAKIAGRG
jgi:hypothetical protein